MWYETHKLVLFEIQSQDCCYYIFLALSNNFSSYLSSGYCYDSDR
jgi:hypothetical protein